MYHVLKGLALTCFMVIVEQNLAAEKEFGELKREVAALHQVVDEKKLAFDQKAQRQHQVMLVLHTHPPPPNKNKSCSFLRLLRSNSPQALLWKS